MSNSRSEIEYFIHLISCAINGREPVAQESVDYSALLALAKKHQVYNIIFPIIKDNPDVPEKEKISFRNFHLSEVSRMININNEREQIYDSLDEAGIDYMPLKGLIIKHYYPKESMRQMSDNDILFDASRRDDVASIMKKAGYKTVATGENSDDYNKPPHCTFEFHRTLFYKQHDFCPTFDNLWENATKDSTRSNMYHMGINDVYIYSVSHMYKHFSSAGCGVRFLVDHYLFLKKENDNLDWDYINDFFNKNGIADYEEKSRRLAFRLFDELPLDESDWELLQTYINFGIYGDGNIILAKQLDKLADGDSIDKAKKKYFLYRLFPPKSKMIADYRTLEKRPYLLPLFYILRLFRGLKNSHKTINEIKNVNKIDK